MDDAQKGHFAVDTRCPMTLLAQSRTRTTIMTHWVHGGALAEHIATLSCLYCSTDTPHRHTQTPRDYQYIRIPALTRPTVLLNRGRHMGM